MVCSRNELAIGYKQGIVHSIAFSSSSRSSCGLITSFSRPGTSGPGHGYTAFKITYASGDTQPVPRAQRERSTAPAHMLGSSIPLSGHKGQCGGLDSSAVKHNVCESPGRKKAPSAMRVTKTSASSNGNTLLPP